MAGTPKHSVSVAAVIRDKQRRVLVMRRADNDQWEIPGGVLELGESFEAGVCREVLEETGMSVAVESLSGVYKNMTRGIVALVFRCAPGFDTMHVTAEAAEVRWMTRDEVVASMTPAFAVRVTDAFQDGTHYRAHDGVQLTASLPS